MNENDPSMRITPPQRACRRQFSQHPPVCKRYSGDDEVLIGVKIKELTEPVEDRTPILCRRCRNEITAVEYVTRVNDRHEHTFTNPAGITYRIGCFSDAYGCFVHGVPAREYTWFPGYSWCFCTCANCFAHLGWFYQSGETSFFGLILDNLVRDVRLH